MTPLALPLSGPRTTVTLPSSDGGWASGGLSPALLSHDSRLSQTPQERSKAGAGRRLARTHAQCFGDFLLRTPVQVTQLRAKGMSVRSVHLRP